MCCLQRFFRSKRRGKRRGRSYQPPNLEGITDKQVAAAAPNLSIAFVYFTGLAALVHTVFVVTTAVEFAVVPRFTLWFRSVVAFRLVLLLLIMTRAVCCRPVDVVALYGTGHKWKMLRFFSQKPLLGLWLLLGFVEHWTLRWMAIVLDLSALFFGEPLSTVLIWVTVDIAFIFEFRLTLYFMYWSAVRGNVYRNLIMTLPG